jgi:short-subunit dehydrogenase
MKVLVLGATSAIAQAAARVWAKRGAELFLVARNGARLSAVAEDLTARGAKVLTLAQDLDDASLHEGLIENALMALGELDVVLLAQGVLGEPAETDRDPAAAERVLRTNLTAPVQFLTLVAQRLRAGASIAALSSVAGDRGRAQNGVYGASKAGLDAFLSGLRQRLRAPLFASAASVGRGIVRAIDRKRDVAYLPGWWRYVMALIRAIPETLFKRMRF